VLEWSGKTPALIKALRVDPIIHADAIYALNKRCTFKLNFASITLISEMRDSIWDKIENLSVRQVFDLNCKPHIDILTACQFLVAVTIPILFHTEMSPTKQAPEITELRSLWLRLRD